MGIEIDKISYSSRDYAAFQARLEENLNALRDLAETPGFGCGPATLGAELEM